MAAGVQAALLARGGARVDPRAIHGPVGFEAVVGARWPSRLRAGATTAAGADAARAIEHNWIKLYPSCLGTHSPIEAAALARSAGAGFDDGAVEVRVHPVARQAAHLDEVTDGLSAKSRSPTASPTRCSAIRPACGTSRTSIRRSPSVRRVIEHLSHDLAPDPGVVAALDLDQYRYSPLVNEEVVKRPAALARVGTGNADLARYEKPAPSRTGHVVIAGDQFRVLRQHRLQEILGVVTLLVHCHEIRAVQHKDAAAHAGILRGGSAVAKASVRLAPESSGVRPRPPCHNTLQLVAVYHPANPPRSSRQATVCPARLEAPASPRLQDPARQVQSEIVVVLTHAAEPAPPRPGTRVAASRVRT